jgi:sugar phosphate isomerase/epimerase
MTIRLGGHGLPVGSDDPYAFAKAHVAFGYGAAYVPASLKPGDPKLKDWEKAFAEADVVLAEIGIWRNLITPDRGDRRRNLDYAIEKLAVAEEVGARCAVSYLGSLKADTDYGPAAENFSREGFQVCVESIREIIDAVKPKRTTFAVEMMQYGLPDSIDSYIELLRAVDRPQFAAHFDPVNWVIHPRTYWNTAGLIDELFNRLGAVVVSCHAKDIVLHHKAALHYDEVMPGKGVLDYGRFLSWLDRMPTEVPLMLEHLEGAQYAEARDAIYKAGDAAWVQFKHRP